MSKKTKKITSIGGSALIEGIMMRGPKKSTVCVRTGKDEIGIHHDAKEQYCRRDPREISLHKNGLRFKKFLHMRHQRDQENGGKK